MDINQVTSRSISCQISAEIATAQQGFYLARFQRDNIDLRIFERRTRFRRREQNSVPSRQHLRPAVREFLFAKIGDRMRSSARSGNALQASRYEETRRNISVLSPTCAAKGGRIGEGDWRASTERDLLQLAIRSKSYGLAVGREEHVTAVLGAGQRRDRGSIQETRG